MITETDTPFQTGFLMGMEAVARGESICAPLWVRRDDERLRQFNKGVIVAYGLWEVLKR